MRQQTTDNGQRTTDSGQRTTDSGTRNGKLRKRLIGSFIGLSAAFLAAQPAHALMSRADYNCDESITTQDLFDFLGGWFAGNVKADINFSGTITVQDIFDFNNLWFAGPSVVEPPSLTIDIGDVNDDSINDYVVLSPYGLFTQEPGKVKVLGGGNKGLICQFDAPAGENLFGIAAEMICDHDEDGKRELAVASIIDPTAEHPVGVIHVYSLAACTEVAASGFNADDHPMQGGGAFLLSVPPELAELAEFSTIGDEAIYAYAESACDVVVSNVPVGPAPTAPTKPIPVPGWSPPGTIPTTPAWTPGGWPIPGPGTTGWFCSPPTPIGGGAYSCICSRAQQWGHWETKPAITFCGWIIVPAKDVWRVFYETETCTNIVETAAGCTNPPSASSNCTSSHSEHTP